MSTPVWSNSVVISTPTPRFHCKTPNPNQYPSSFHNPNVSIISPLSTFPQLVKSPATMQLIPASLSESPLRRLPMEVQNSQRNCDKSEIPENFEFAGVLKCIIVAGYWEKVFAIVGVKVYAAGLYVNPSILSELSAWKGRAAAEIQENSSIFNKIFRIVLLRDVDGKTFWDALDEAISPRITSPMPVDESALSTFRSIFQGRSLRKGTLIFLTWLDPCKMQVSVSSDGLPSGVDATIESSNVTSALYDVLLGKSLVSPSLKTSVSNGLATALK